MRPLRSWQGSWFPHTASIQMHAAQNQIFGLVLALFHRWCTEQSTEKVEWISDVPFRVRSSTVSLWGMKRRAANLVTTPGFDPSETSVGDLPWQ